MFSIRAVFPAKKESVQLLVRYPPNMQFHFEDILRCWFVEITPSQWWDKSDTFDQMILQPFQKNPALACQGELFDWRDEPLF